MQIAVPCRGDGCEHTVAGRDGDHLADFEPGVRRGGCGECAGSEEGGSVLHGDVPEIYGGVGTVLGIGVIDDIYVAWARILPAGEIVTGFDDESDGGEVHGAGDGGYTGLGKDFTVVDPDCATEGGRVF